MLPSTGHTAIFAFVMHHYLSTSHLHCQHIPLHPFALKFKGKNGVRLTIEQCFLQGTITHMRALYSHLETNCQLETTVPYFKGKNGVRLTIEQCFLQGTITHMRALYSHLETNCQLETTVPYLWCHLPPRYWIKSFINRLWSSLMATMSFLPSSKRQPAPVVTFHHCCHSH